MTTNRPLHEVDLNLLVALDALLAEQNVTRAAKRLEITQPAMSHALQRLRALLQDPLFVRTPRGVTPTPRALKLKEPVEQLLSGFAQLLERDEFEPKTSQRQFTIASADVGQMLLAAGLLERVRKAASGVSIVLKQAGPGTLEALEAGELDLVIGGAREVPAHFRRLKLLADPPRLYARRRHPRVHGRVSLQQLAELPHVRLSYRDGLGGPLNAALKAKGLTPQFKLAVDAMAVAMAVVAKTDLVLVAGAAVLAAFEQMLPIEAFELEGSHPSLEIAMLWHERHHKDQGHAWLRRQVQEALEA